MPRRIPFRGQGHVYVTMDLACGHQGRSEAANDGVTPVRLAAWCVTCQSSQPRQDAPGPCRVDGCTSLVCHPTPRPER